MLVGMNSRRRSHTAARRQTPWSVSRQLACGAVAGPLFVAAFTVIGAARAGYDWRRHAVSSLACGHAGWLQRVNFVVAGALYCAAGRGLRKAPQSAVGSRAVPALVKAAGVGLIGSGLFVTDPVGGFPPTVAAAEEGTDDPALAPPRPTREGMLHNVSALPIFVGIPVAGLAAAAGAVRAHEYRWACRSAASSVAMVGSFLLFGAAFGEKRNLGGHGGVFQRLSIVSGFGWVTALSIRALRAVRQL